MDSFKFWAEFCFVQNYLNLFPTLFNVSLTCLFVCTQLWLRESNKCQSVYDRDQKSSASPQDVVDLSKILSNHVHHNGSKKALTQVFTVNGGIAVFARR